MDGDLSAVTVEGRDANGAIAGSASTSVSSEAADHVESFEIDEASHWTFEVRLTVIESATRLPRALGCPGVIGARQRWTVEDIQRPA